jgi:DNA-binding IclR family transcriptional regulator
MTNSAINASVDKALEVFAFFLGQDEGWTISDLSRRTGMYKSRIHRIIKTFEKHEIFRLNEKTGKYELGPMMKINSVMQNGKHLSQRVHQILYELSKETSGTAILRKKVGWELLTVDVAVSDHPLRISYEKGTRHPLTFGAAAKIFIAYDSPPFAEVLKHYQHRLPAFTKRSITDPGKWRVSISKVKAKGYYFSDGEAIWGGRGIAVPVMDKEQRLLAALSLALPTVLFPLHKVPQLVAKTKQSAGKIGELLS